MDKKTAWSFNEEEASLKDPEGSVDVVLKKHTEICTNERDCSESQYENTLRANSKKPFDQHKVLLRITKELKELKVDSAQFVDAVKKKREIDNRVNK